MKTVNLKLSKGRVKIILALLEMDGAQDFIGKETDLEWDDVFATAADIRKQLKQQAT
jgi:hypothetical protein